MTYGQIQNAIGRIMIYMADAVVIKPHDYTHQLSEEQIINYLESSKDDIDKLINKIKHNEDCNAEDNEDEDDPNYFNI
jgi:hypothetical protein